MHCWLRVDADALRASDGSRPLDDAPGHAQAAVSAVRWMIARREVAGRN